MVNHTLRSPLAVVALLALSMTVQSTVQGQKLLVDAIADLATQVNASATQQQKQKVAVIPFRELDGRQTVLGTYLAEALVTELFRRGGLEIVERTMLDPIMAELRLGQSGLVDPNTARRVGQVAGVDAIVTGTITDLQSFVAVNCRLIDVETGRVFAAADTRIVKDDDVRKIMGVGLGNVSATGLPSGSVESVTVSGSAEWSDAGLRLQVVRIDRSRTGTRVTAVLTNLGSQALTVRFHRENPDRPDAWRHYLADDLGNRYPAVSASVMTGYYADVEIMLNVPLRVDWLFAAMTPSARTATLVVADGFDTIGPDRRYRSITLGPIELPR